MFPKIYCKSVFKVLSRSTEMQHDEHLTKVDNTTQMIMEIYFDIQTAARGNTSTTPSIETHLAVVRGLPTKKFQTEYVNEKSSTERRS